MLVSRMIKSLSLLFLVVMLALSGCAGKNGDTANPGGSQKDSPKDEGKTAKPIITANPVTLKLYHGGGDISEEEFKKYFVDTVAKKYPNITLEYVNDSDPGHTPEELLAGGDFPDIIYTAPTSVPNFSNLNVIEDLTPYIKKFDVDMSQFVPVAQKLTKGYDPQPAKVVALPFTLNLAAMIFNKDIFDKFAVAYPKEKMSWDEAIALSKKLTRNEDGVQYIGIDPWRPESIGAQMELPYVDPKTNKALINTDGWATVLNIFKEVVETPGFVNDKKYNYDFFKDNLAMYPIWETNLVAMLSKPEVAKSRNWDLVAIPYVKGYEGQGRNGTASLMMISNVSKHKDEAFAVLKEVVSKEVQMTMSRDGRISSLKDESLQKEFLKDNPVFNGKNVKAFYETTPATFPPFTIYDKGVANIVRSAKEKLALDHTDINTLLRELQEQADQYIQSQK